MTDHTHDSIDAQPPRSDELDTLLREWHEQNRAAAAAGRDRLLAALRTEQTGASTAPAGADEGSPEDSDHSPAERSIRHTPHRRPTGLFWSFSRVAVLAAAMIALAVIVPMLVPDRMRPSLDREAVASNIVLAPEGGRLDALDAEGNILGPCVLKHTDVDVRVTGRFARVNVRQQYHNPHKDKIEAIYTFPLSHDSAVDRMNMTIGNRVIVGEVHEREEARQIYEQARDSGRVASLLEQERPNIFTQSVANIEPGADITIEISYIETIPQRDGEFSFVFPTVVAPRYIPGGGSVGEPEGVVPLDLRTQHLEPRPGLVLLAPANAASISLADGALFSVTPTESELTQALVSAQPIRDPEVWSEATDRDATRDEAGEPARSPSSPTGRPATHDWISFMVVYPDGSQEPGWLRDDGTGTIAGRWFYCPQAEKLARPNTARGSASSSTDASKGAAASATAPGAPFASGTAQVPDASRITPMPVPPTTRPGHDLSIKVEIDTGGPGIRDLRAPIHQVTTTEWEKRADGLSRRTTVALANGAEIPNRDFALSWRQTDDTVQDAVFTHAGEKGNFVGVLLTPPARVADSAAVPRELVFVLDTSGSMSGTPIETAKKVMNAAIASMRSLDTFNVVTFAGHTQVLWDAPRPATQANRDLATKFVTTQRGGGGTEMMAAIEAALAPSPRSERQAGIEPLRVVMFLTDGEVGNDMAIIDAVRKYRASTRVFSFGIGSSVNRYLLAGMARAGGGESEFVLLNRGEESPNQTQLDEIVTRFTRRTQTPVLTNISVELSPGLTLLDMDPSPGNIPDVFDVSPLLLLARYPDTASPIAGTLTIRGQTGTGRWEKTIYLALPPSGSQPSHDVLATLWARRQIEGLMNSDLALAQRGQVPAETRGRIVDLGTTYGIMSAYTSFVAVDKLRLTIDGRPRLVHVPVALPDQTSWEGYFGILPEQIEAASNTVDALNFDPMSDEDETDRGEAAHAYGLEAAPAAATAAGPSTKAREAEAPAQRSAGGWSDLKGADRKKQAHPSPSEAGAPPAPVSTAATPAPAAAPSSATGAAPPPGMPRGEAMRRGSPESKKEAGAAGSNTARGDGRGGQSPRVTIGSPGDSGGIPAEKLGTSVQRPARRLSAAEQNDALRFGTQLDTGLAGSSLGQSEAMKQTTERGHAKWTLDAESAAAPARDDGYADDSGAALYRHAPTAVREQLVAAAEVYRNARIAQNQLRANSATLQVSPDNTAASDKAVSDESANAQRQAPSPSQSRNRLNSIAEPRLQSQAIVRDLNRLAQSDLDAAQDKQLDELANRARAQFDRAAALLRKVDARLLAFLETDSAAAGAQGVQPEEHPSNSFAGANRDKDPESGAAGRISGPNDPVLVVMLLSDASPKVLELLRLRGLDVVSADAQTRTVVGRLRPSDLEAMVRIDEVLKIDPVDEAPTDF